MVLVLAAIPPPSLACPQALPGHRRARPGGAHDRAGAFRRLSPFLACAAASLATAGLVPAGP